MTDQEITAQKIQWVRKKLLALKVIEVLGRGNRLSVWQHAGGKLVEIVEIKFAPYGCKLSYFQSGKQINLPGSLTILGWKDTPELRAKVINLCEHICKEWDEIKINCDEVAEQKLSLLGSVNNDCAISSFLV